MKTEWDYTGLAEAYLHRPDYSPAIVDSLLTLAGVQAGDRVCDVGAGVAHLTLMLAARGLLVEAIEPNDAMRIRGMQRTHHLEQVHWTEGTGEATGQPGGSFRLVTFGSSFNVCDRPQALVESARILTERGWFACMWNHRQLEDPIQMHIEEIIRAHVQDYRYGTRREDQTDAIEASGLFARVLHLDARVRHRQSISDCVSAWRSHATLQRQAGMHFAKVIAEIEQFLTGLGRDHIDIPYNTHLWLAQRRKATEA